MRTWTGTPPFLHWQHTTTKTPLKPARCTRMFGVCLVLFFWVVLTYTWYTANISIILLSVIRVVGWFVRLFVCLSFGFLYNVVYLYRSRATSHNLYLSRMKNEALLLCWISTSRKNTPTLRSKSTITHDSARQLLPGGSQKIVKLTNEI